MDQDISGASHGGFLSKLVEFHTPRSVNPEHPEQQVTLEKINYPWLEIIFPVTLMIVSLISVILISIILIFWLKQNSKSQSKLTMSQELSNLEENLVHEDRSEDAMLILNFKDKLDECNELENFSDENHSPNIDKNKSGRKIKDGQSPKCFKPETPDSKKQWILHSAPPIEIKQDISVQPSIGPKSPKGLNSPLKCTTPNIFKFEVKSVPPDSFNRPDTNIFNFSLSSPFSSNDSANYYTPKTSVSPETSRAEYSVNRTKPNLYTHSPINSLEEDMVTDTDTKFNYSPRSCEYYSAKSTLKTPYEHFKFPEPETQQTNAFDFEEDKSTKLETSTNLSIATAENLNIENSSIMHRRARLKSISLDSDSACLVEAHLSVPMINLMKSHDNNNRSDMMQDLNSNSPNTPKKPRNLNSLTLNLDYKDDSLADNSTRDDMPKTPKTPTLTQTKQKAISLDSSDVFTPLVTLPKLGVSSQNSSVSVPNTPKRFMKKVNHKPPHLVKSNYYVCNPDSLNMSNIGEHLPNSRSYNQKLTHYTRKMGSFDENMMELSQTRDCKKLSANKSEGLLGTNLQHFKSSLSVSNNNLKTLPEVMPLSDFKISCDNNASKKSILQRRGSNQSLTLNLDSNFKSSYLSLQGSVSNLTNCRMLSASNYSLQAGSSYNIYEHGNKQKKCLLQRRGSNNSLSLNLQKSNLNLNRFNSQSSLSINQDRGCRRGLLERRNSNTSLTLNLHHSGAAVADNHPEPATSPLRCSQMRRHRKSLSTESLFECESPAVATQARLVFGSVDDITAKQSHHRPIRNITTRPLSPQANSEDFKTYLANLQILQNATNVLCRAQLRDLNSIFQQGYSKTNSKKDKVDKDKDITEDVAASNIDKFFVSSKLEDLEHQKKSLLHNLHKEFWNLPNNFQEKPIVFGSQGKNRYKSILPNEHSRVVLDVKSASNKEGYINANYIKGYDNTSNSFIVTQGPLPNTIYDFWSMVHQNFNQTSKSENQKQPQKIVMLTNLLESNHQKCAMYFPAEHAGCLEFPDQDNGAIKFIVRNVGVKFKHGYSLRKLTVELEQNGESKTKELIVFHYWFEGWPDHKSPDDVHVLLDMSLHILDADCELDFCNSCTRNSSMDDDSIEITRDPKREEGNAPLPIVHCSAGIGRTGCLVAILNGVQQFRNTERVDVLGIVCNMRLSRGGMVQNSEQYELVHRVLCLFEQQS